MNKIVAVVPCYKDAQDLSAVEKRSLCNNLAKLDGVAQIVLACSTDVDASRYHEMFGDGFSVKFFDAGNFRSIHTYNHLLKSLSFYKAFEDFDFMLIVQTDVYIFRADYDEFLNYDYVGAPWSGHGLAHLKCIHPVSDPFFVGNGGYSLRKIASFIQVLETDARLLTNRQMRELIERGSEFHTQSSRLHKWLAGFWYLRFQNSTRHGKNRLPFIYEDVFWAMCVPRACDFFKVAPTDVGFRFAFEVEVAHCFEQTSGHLPTGTHAFEKHPPKIWRPFIAEK